MKNFRNKAQVVEILNPSELILDVDEFFQLSSKLPSQSPILRERETKIFDQLGIRKTKFFDNYMISEVKLGIIEQDINSRFQDGFDMEDELSVVRYPFDRSIRVKSELEDPTKEKTSLLGRISSIKVGNPHILENDRASLQRFNTSLLALSSTFDTPSRTR